MSANIAIGIQDFSTLIENHYFYVDKTDFIKEWWDCGDSVTLITRPRRFGKTLTMSMVEQFFSVEYSGRFDLFEDLKICADTKYRTIQGTYPVISLSFANVKEPTYQLAEKKICELIAQLYVKYDFITESGKLRDTEVKLYKKIMNDMEYVDATLSLEVWRRQGHECDDGRHDGRERQVREHPDDGARLPLAVHRGLRALCANPGAS